MSVRTLLSALAFSLDPEGADVGPVPLVVGRRPRQLGKEVVLLRRDLAQGAARVHAVRFGQAGIRLL